MSIAVGEGEGRKVLCRGMRLDVMRGEKIAIIGPNGVGKSSLLKAIQELIPLEEGHFEWGQKVKTTYYEQENRQLHPEKTAINEIWDRFPNLYEVQVRSILGQVLLSGDDVYKLVGSLSGGERAKVAFAVMMLERGNVLILDEPTNHRTSAARRCWRMRWKRLTAPSSWCPTTATCSTASRTASSR